MPDSCVYVRIASDVNVFVVRSRVSIILRMPRHCEGVKRVRNEVGKLRYLTRDGRGRDPVCVRTLQIMIICNVPGAISLL